jgi:hypothetical protein
MRMWIGILLAVLLALTALRQGGLIAGIRFDGENSPIESDSMFALNRVCDGQTLYLDYSDRPYVLTAYMPLFYWTTGAIARVEKGWLERVVVARCCVYAYWVGIGIVIFAVARQVNCSWCAALAAALLWGASELGEDWANSLRPDAAALFFSLAALWVYQRGQRPVNVIVSIGLLVVAFLHKQTVAAPLGLILLEELLCKRFRRAAMMAAAWAVMTVGVMVAGQWLTNGHFAQNVFGIVLRGPWLWTWAAFTTAVVTGATAFWGATLACMATSRQTGVALWKRYFIISLALTFARSRIFGTWTNHYLEPFAVGCVLTGVLVQDLLALGPKDVVRWGRLCWLVGALGISIALVIDLSRQAFRPGRDTDDTPWKQFVARLDEINGPVLAEDGYVAVRGGRTPVLIDANLFSHAQRNGKFSDTELLRTIQDGGFAAVVTKFPIDATRPRARSFPQRWLEPMRGRYRLEATYPVPERDVTFYLYVPEGIQ